MADPTALEDEASSWQYSPASTPVQTAIQGASDPNVSPDQTEQNEVAAITYDPQQAKAQAQQQAIQDRQQQAAYRVSGQDLSRRGIGYYTDLGTGAPTPVTDESGAPLTNFSQRSGVGYDSQGNPRKLSFDSQTGAPELKDPYEGAPQTTDKAGNIYTSPSGLPWRFEGVNPDIQKKNQEAQQAKLDAAAVPLLTGPVAMAKSKFTQMQQAVDQSEKSTAATLQSLGVSTTDQKGQPIDLTNTDPTQLRQMVQGSFDSELKSSEANDKSLFGSGLTQSAEALRQDIGNRQKHASDALDNHIGVVSAMQQAGNDYDQARAPLAAINVARINRLNDQREAAGMQPIPVPDELLRVSKIAPPPIPGMDHLGNPVGEDNSKQTTAAFIPDPSKNKAWNQMQAQSTADANAAGLPPVPVNPNEGQNRTRILDAISRVESSGYKVNHFMGQPDEPEGDRGPTMDTENLVKALQQKQSDQTKSGDQQGAQATSKELAYWQNDIAKNGMTSDQWKKGTGEADPVYPTSEINRVVKPPASTAVPQEPEGALQSFLRPLETGLAPALGTAAGGAVGALAGDIGGGVVPNPVSIAAAIAGDVAGGAAGGLLAQKAQNALMGGEWTDQNQAHMAANAKNHPIASALGSALPMLVSMLGGGGAAKTAGEGLEKAAQGLLSRTVSATEGNPGLLTKAMSYLAEKSSALPTVMTQGARIGGAQAAEEDVNQKKSFYDVLPAAIKGAVTFGPTAFVPAAASLLGNSAKGLGMAGVMEASNALYDHFVEGKPIDAKEMATRFGTSGPAFAIQEALMGVLHGTAPERGGTEPPEAKGPTEPVAPTTPESAEKAVAGRVVEPGEQPSSPVAGMRHTGTDEAKEYMDKGGWKLHLTVPPENYGDVDSWLDKNHSGPYKLLNGGDAGEKDFTVYVGDKAKADSLASKIQNEIGDKLSKNNAGSDDTAFTDKVSGRFGGQGESGAYRYYGRNGIPYDQEAKEAESQVRMASDPESKAQWQQILSNHENRIKNELTEKFGSRFSGISPPAETPIAATEGTPAEQAPAAVSTEIPGVPKTPEGNQAHSDATSELESHASTLGKLDHPVEFASGTTEGNKSGFEYNPSDQRIHMDADKVADATKGMDDGKRKEWIKRAVGEEVIHAATDKWAQEGENGKKLESLADDKEAMDHAAKTYGEGWPTDKRSQASEYVRMLIQGKEKLTESSYKVLHDFLNWIGERLGKLTGSEKEVVDGIRERMGDFAKDHASKQEAIPGFEKESPATSKLREAHQDVLSELNAARDALKSGFGDEDTEEEIRSLEAREKALRAKLTPKGEPEAKAEAPKEIPGLESKPESQVGSKVRVGNSPQLHTITEELAPQKGDLPDEKYFKVTNDKTGREQTVESKDITPVKERTAEEKQSAKAASEKTTQTLDKKLRDAGLNPKDFPDADSKRYALGRKKALGAANPDEYDAAQKKIDAIEDKLEGEGHNVIRMVDISDKGGKFLVENGNGEWSAMPQELADAYRERDAIGAKQFEDSKTHIRSKLADIGLSKSEQDRILDYYGINPDKSDAASQSIAAEHAVKLANQNPAKQAESLSYALAADRNEHFDELKDVSKNSLVDAAKSVKAVREYFGIDTPKRDALEQGEKALGAANPSDDKSKEAATPEVEGKPPSESPQSNPSHQGASVDDILRAEDGKTAGERLIRQADEAGMSYSLETLKGMIREDPKTMETMRNRIKAAGKEPLGAANPMQWLREKQESIARLISNAKADSSNASLRDRIKSGNDSTGTLAHLEGENAKTSIRLDFERPAPANESRRDKAIREAQNKRDLQAARFVAEAGGDKANLLSEKAKIDASPDAKLRDKFTPIIDHAIANFDRLEPLVEKGHAKLADETYDLLIATGEDFGKRDQYVRRVTIPPADPDQPNPLFKLGSGRGNSPKDMEKSRWFDTIGDAVKAGYDPGTYGIHEADQNMVTNAEKIVGGKAFLDQMKKIVSPTDKKPIIGELQKRTLPNGETETKVPDGYSMVTAPGGRPMVIHNLFAGLFKSLWGDSAIRQHWTGRAALKAAAATKTLTFVADTFHVGRVLYKAVTSRNSLPELGKGLSLVEYAPKDLDRAVANGELKPHEAEWAKENRPIFDEGIKHGLNIGKIADNLVDQAKLHLPGFGKINDWIFQSLTRDQMAQTYVDFAKRNVEQIGEGKRFDTRDQAIRQAAKETNEMYGNLQNQGLFQNKTMQDLSRLIFLAPQWAESQFRNEARSYGQGAKAAYQAARTGGNDRFVGNSARAFASGFVALLAANQVANYISRGQSTFQNKEDDHKLDAWLPGGKNGFWFNPFEIAGEYAHAASKYAAQHENAADIAGHVVNNKLSPMARGAKEALTGRDYAGRKFLSDTDRFRAAAVDALPSPLPLSAVAEKDPRAPLGYRVTRAPGAVEKQLLQSSGMKVTPAQSPRTQMFSIAQDYRADRQRPDIAGEYTELRRALDNDDTRGVKDEIKWLQDRGHSMQAISESVGLSKGGAIKPEMFAGSHAREQEMLAKLTPAQKVIYDQAQRDHALDAIKFLRIASTGQRPQPAETGTPFRFK